MLLAAPVNGTEPVDPGGWNPLALPTMVPKVVAPTGLFAPGPVTPVGLAETGAGDPAAKPTFEPVAPGAAGPVVKPT